MDVELRPGRAERGRAEIESLAPLVVVGSLHVMDLVVRVDGAYGRESDTASDEESGSPLQGMAPQSQGAHYGRTCRLSFVRVETVSRVEGPYCRSWSEHHALLRRKLASTLASISRNSR